MTVYIVEVTNKKYAWKGISQVGYKTLEGALQFIRSRSDYAGQSVTNWRVETEDHIYTIKDIKIE